MAGVSAVPAEKGIVAEILPFAVALLDPCSDIGQRQGADKNDAGQTHIRPRQAGQQGQGRTQGQQGLWRDEGPGRKKIKPEEFEENTDADCRVQVEAEQCPNEGSEKRALDEPDVQGSPGQGEQGKKKPPPVRSKRSVNVIMDGKRSGD